MLQVICVSIIYETRADHIKASIAAGLGEGDAEYDSAERNMIVVCVFFWVMGLIEFIIIFQGETLFNT